MSKKQAKISNETGKTVLKWKAIILPSFIIRPEYNSITVSIEHVGIASLKLEKRK